MIETLIVALLIWLWVIERRLGALQLSNNAHKLDIDGLRLEVAKLHSADVPGKTAVLNPPKNAALG